MSIKINKSIHNNLLEDGTLRGVSSSNGIAIARAFVVLGNESSQKKIDISSCIDSENLILKFQQIIKNLSDDYQILLDNSQNDSPEVLQIIETYQLIVNDPIMIDSIIKRIIDCNNIEIAVTDEFEAQKKLFSNSKDKIIGERVDDLENIKVRILNELNNNELVHSQAKDKIVISESFTPSDLLKFAKAGARGFISERGGIASHISILARSVGLPAVIDVKNATKVITNNQNIILDAFSGMIFYKPSSERLEYYDQKLNEIKIRKEKLGQLIKVPTKTIDGKEITLLANIDRIEDAKLALLNACGGIGLTRTEMFLNEHEEIPNEDIQYKWYSEIANLMYPNEVTLRCFDIGSDKYTNDISLEEDNPALGLRGIRYLLYDKNIFKTQIKAILRASENKNIKIMLPMISDIDELQQSKDIIKECMLELQSNNLHFDSNIPIGIMIETPAAAIMSDSLAKECDFFSIGTNDLTQYTLAVDRTNKFVNYLFNSLHISVLKLIAQTINAANANNIPISICGALASQEEALELLVGMGIKNLSVPASILLEIKSKILEINYKNANKLTNNILNCNETSEISKLLRLSERNK